MKNMLLKCPDIEMLLILSERNVVTKLVPSE